MSRLVPALTMGAKVWRTLAGDDSALERLVKARYLRAVGSTMQREEGPGWIQQSGSSFVVVRSKSRPEPRIGIIARGGCDLPSLFSTAAFIREDVEGTVAIYKPEGTAGASRTDQLLQTLDEIPEEQMRETTERLELNPQIFAADFFDPAPFEISGFGQFGTFPKKAVVISVGSDLARSLYRHREHGYLVDLGRWWLNQSLEKAIGDTDALDWFRRAFEPVGKISAEGFQANLEEIVRLVRERIGAHVIVYNSLVLDPLNPTHNYQLVNKAHSLRRREFHLALAEVSAKLDVPIVDVDRVLKEDGIREQVDFAHFPIERMSAIGRRAYRIFKELEIV